MLQSVVPGMHPIDKTQTNSLAIVSSYFDVIIQTANIQQNSFITNVIDKHTNAITNQRPWTRLSFWHPNPHTHMSICQSFGNTEQNETFESKN